MVRAYWVCDLSAVLSKAHWAHGVNVNGNDAAKWVSTETGRGLICAVVAGAGGFSIAYSLSFSVCLYGCVPACVCVCVPVAVCVSLSSPQITIRASYVQIVCITRESVLVSIACNMRFVCVVCSANMCCVYHSSICVQCTSLSATEQIEQRDIKADGWTNREHNVTATMWFLI